MNLVILKGNLGKDPEIKSFEWGKVASFSIATTEKYKNGKGELITETDWHNCTFRGAICDAIEKYLHKGDQVLVTGKIKYRSYENKDSQTVHITEIKCSEFEFCSGKKESTPELKEDVWHGKKPVTSMSNPDDLPGSNDISDLPY